ncbi:MAG: hypothetical protein QM719_10225 [Thermomonas sp.]
MSGSIENDARFLAGLDPEQRRYFLARESAKRDLLQAALRDLARGIGVVSALNGEAQSLLLDWASKG